ncbi:Histone acetyltransferases subunit 3 [Penicillium paradoxum]|uniref:Histone acetyltransferases subunit 3 n=1 Tax=Penicillium paradoxum TaxID=176176 RepID=UPI00254722FB|nr:Histone acetyltransferases subunit 3 [Penicillium paradoxum]KAJ5788617.1 Histone acetyltransferases subunit 3 [Penicillium paradoxum]
MPAAYKGKGKGRDARQSRSRNTTPSSASAPAIPSLPVQSYLENDVTKHIDQASLQYSDVLDLVSAQSIPDSKTLETLVEHLKSLSDMADNRGEVCNAGMREMSQKRKEVEDQELDREVQNRAKLKRETEEDDDIHKGGKLKKRKERASAKEERPLNHGAHEVARQDGAETKVEGAASPASKNSKNALFAFTSIDDVSQRHDHCWRRSSPGTPGSETSADSHQPEPQPAIPQVQIFGENPLKYDDPTVYNIRDVLPDMTDDEKKEIYSVARFPKSDLAHMAAGVAPDKDFSNAKPSNQVSANTFQTYIEPYVRPLTEEDIAWLKERGDRTTPFIMPRRGKKSYRQIWAEEDGVSYDSSQDDKDQLPLNQGRGSIEQLTDDKTETNEVSVGPLLSRLCSLLRYEHRTFPEDTNPTTNGDTSSVGGLGGDAMDIDQPNGDKETKSEPKPLPAATTFRDADPNDFKTSVAKLDHAQLDERAKAELRYIGFLGADDNPDYDAHYDDEVAERLRLLQSELKKQIVTNNARKARILKIAQEHMAMLEFTTIQDDLDSQVQQAYLKRTRTMGKSKKGAQAKHRPGGAGGGSHVAGAAGVSRPAVGDAAKIVMDRRRRWNEAFLPIFEDIKTTIPSEGESIFDPEVMAEYEKAELENWDEE